jgi:predicted MPP superfamily phosphohydrolase
MNRIVMFALFFLVFLSIYGLLNYYVLWRLSTLFGVKRTIGFFVALAVLTLSFLAAMLLESRSAGGANRAFYFVAMAWMGAVFLLACVLALHELARLLLPLAPQTYGIIVLIIGGVLILGSLVNGALLSVRSVELASPKLTKQVRLVQVTDIHLGLLRDDAWVARIVEKIRTLNPDAILITGDLIDGSGTYDPKTLGRFDSLGKPVFFVTGNHEGFAGAGIVESLINQTKFRWLRNESVAFKGIEIIGIDDGDNRGAVAEALTKIPVDQQTYSVLLYHRPGAWAYLNGPDLTLSGHTHDGQLFPFNLIIWPFEHPVTGLHRRGNMTLYVSPGTGTWGPPMRLGSRNEITLITLTPTP